MNTNGRMEAILDSSNKVLFKHIRSTRHWTTILTIILAGAFSLFGIFLLSYIILFGNRSLPIVFFGGIFAFFGGIICVKSTIDFFFRPKDIYFQIKPGEVSWSENKTKIYFDELSEIAFFIDGTDMDSIYFRFNDGTMQKFINNRFMSEHQMRDVYSCINSHFEGNVKLNESLKD